MKKKIALLVTFILAFVVSLAVFAGCGGGETVTVNGLSEAITLEVGKTRNLTATASDGSELVWASSDTSVATVSDKGRVEAKKAGTTNVTATVKGGTASATCVVTVKDPVVFTFKNGATVVTELTVDRDKDPVQLTATASDGSTITNWSSADEGKVSVSQTGLITGNKETGDNPVLVTVKTSTGSGTIAVTVIDTAEHEAIVEGAGKATVGKWWYYTNTAQNRNPEIITNELRKGIIAFEFGGNVNWNTGDVQLGRKKDATAKTGWTALSGKITSSTDGTLRIFNTTISVQTGENEFTVYYDQADNENDVVITVGNNINSGKFEIKVADLKWEEYEVQDLDALTFTLSGNTVTITDTNEAGVREYQVGFFNADGNLVTVQNSADKSIEIDPTAIETNGTYTLKVRAMGVPGYNDSEWSSTTEEYVVNNSGITYQLEWTTKSGTRWTYYSVPEDSTGKAEEATYADGVVTFKTAYLGWKFDSTQMYRNYPQFTAGATLKLDMKINSNQAGRITVSGHVVKLEAGDNEFTVYITQPSGGTTLSILFGENSSKEGDSGMDWKYDEGGVEFTIQVVSIVDYTPDPLATPSATYTAKDGDTPAKIKITDTENKSDDVASYQVGFFDANDKLIGYTAIKTDETFSDLAIKNGTYSLKVRAVPKTGQYTNSAWSAVITEYEVANDVTITPLPNGGEHDSYTTPDKWYEWHDQDWNGSKVTLGDAYTTSKGEIYFSFTISGTNQQGQAAHLYYHYSTLTAGKAYTITLKINSTSACEIEVCGEKVTLKAGDNNVSVNFIHPEKHGDWQGKDIGSTIRIYFNNNGSFVLSNVQVTELTQTKLTTPSIAIAEDGTVTITNAPAAGAASYVAGFFAEGSETPAGTATVVNGEKIDVSAVPNGTYTVKIMAKGDGTAYTDSDWSAEGASYTVAKATNTMDLVNVLPADVSAPESGWYYYATTDAADWNNWTAVNVSSAVYNIDTKVVTVSYTATGDNAWSLQLIYKFPAGTTSQKIRIQTDFDCQIQAVRGHTAEEANQYDLTAGTPVEITFSGAMEAYIQIPVTKTVTGGTVTLTLVD